MCLNKSKSLYYSILVSTCLVSPRIEALDLNVNLPILPVGDAIGVAVATPYANVNINAGAGTVNGSVFGTKIGISDNQTLNISGTKVKGDVVGLERGLGLINNAATVNINSGKITGDVRVTKDALIYAGVDRRTSNNLNFKGGTVGGNLVGGAGAQQNNIVITGGTLRATSGDDDDDEGHGASGTIYAGSDNAATTNKSANATVTLKDLNNSNSFLSSFVQGAGNSGTIIGGNITGSSELKFDGVNGNFQGGIKDFNTVTITNQSAANNVTNVKLTGNTYNANTWNVNGILDTNGKTLGAYNSPNLTLNVGATGSLTNQLLSSSSVIATNLGLISGINAGLNNITLTNTGILTGIYNGKQVQITNALGGTINGNTSLTSSVAGFLNNSGLINANLTLNGGITINNQSGGNMNNSTVTNNQPVLNINNSGTISNTTYVNSDDLKTINLNNKANGEITNNLTIRNGIMNLNNELNGKLHDANMTSDSAVLNIDNDGKMYGNNSINGINGGTVHLKNDTTGDLTGTLNINSGLESFDNAGKIHDLTINNHINNMLLGNTGIITGNNVINNATGDGFIVNNGSTGDISGILNNAMGDLAIYNAANGKLHDLTMMVSGTGNAYRIENSGLINGNNTINVTNSNGRVIIGNNTGGEITGSINNINGSEITNHDGAKIHDLSFTNSQANTGITNYGDISNLTLTNTDSSKYMTIFNLGENGVGEVKDNLTVNNGTLYLANTGSIHDANVVATNGARIEIYNTTLPPSSNSNGTISGVNTFNGQDTSTIYVTNRAAGTVTGTFNVTNGTTISNQGLIDGLTTNNSQNVLNFTNNAAGVLANTLTFNNSDDTKTVNLNNQSSDVLNGGLVVNEGTLNLNNGAESTINGYAMTTNSSVLNVNNGGTISGINSITNTNGGSALLTNYSNANLGGTLTAIGGVLDIDNLYAGQITNLDLKADTGTVNVSNSGTIGGNTVLENANNGTINLTNQLTGTLKDNLVVKSGLDTFANLGTIAGLTLTNQQATSNP